MNKTFLTSLLLVLSVQAFSQHYKLEDSAYLEVYGGSLYVKLYKSGLYFINGLDYKGNYGKYSYSGDTLFFNNIPYYDSLYHDPAQPMGPAVYRHMKKIKSFSERGYIGKTTKAGYPEYLIIKRKLLGFYDVKHKFIKVSKIYTKPSRLKVVYYNIKDWLGWRYRYARVWLGL